jgi:glc operon protein GlcG
MTTPADTAPLAIVAYAGLALSACRAVAQAAEAAAIAMNCRMCIAVLDGGGHLQHFVRMDGTHIASIEVAIAKARCALTFRRPTKSFADAVAADGMALTALPGIVPFAGGVPLIWRGEVIGAIGISGGTPQLDGQVGQAGADILLTEGDHA